MTNLNLTIKTASFHRNGIGGMGFYAIIFTDADEEGDMIASLFDEPYYCAVYKISELVKSNIEFAMGNSWRGDRYEHALRPLLESWLEEHGGNRIGPFSIISPEIAEQVIAEHLASKER